MATMLDDNVDIVEGSCSVLAESKRCVATR